VAEDDTTTSLTLAVIGESDDPLVVAGELRSAIASGRAAQSCRDIAHRAGDWSDLPDDAVAIAVVTERHDIAARSAGDPSLVDRTVHAQCGLAS
jgi:hypothetical protein